MIFNGHKFEKFTIYLSLKGILLESKKCSKCNLIIHKDNLNNDWFTFEDGFNKTEYRTDNKI